MQRYQFIAAIRELVPSMMKSKRLATKVNANASTLKDSDTSIDNTNLTCTLSSFSRKKRFQEIAVAARLRQITKKSPIVNVSIVIESRVTRCSSDFRFGFEAHLAV